MYYQLGLGELRPTKIMLHLTNRSIVKSIGEIENIFIKIEEFIFPVDFIVLQTHSIVNL